MLRRVNEIAEVLAELVKREPICHRPELGTTRADYERMMDESFREVGASGRATIWRRTNEGWKIVYHQGTLVAME